MSGQIIKSTLLGKKVLSLELKKLLVPSFMILTNGAVCQDLINLENNYRKKPIFPFQKQ